MKKSVDILGLPVIAITDGIEIGKVIDLVVNPKEGIVEYLVLETGVRYSGTKVINVNDVESFGDDAIITEIESAVVEMKNVAHLNELLEKDITIKGTKVLTKKGKIIGVVTEFHIDEQEMGKISGLEIAPAGDKDEIKVFSAQNVVTFGKDAIIVREGNPQPSPNDGAENAAENQSDLAAEQAAVGQVQQPVTEEDNKAMSFEERQRQFLLGRKVSKTILNAAGEVIVKEGTEITEEIIEKVVAANKYADLLMNYTM